MRDDRAYKNAVLDDKELQDALKGINPKFGDFVTRVAGEAWGLPVIDQKTKALIAIAVDVVNQDHTGPGNPFAAHVNIALNQGATRAEIEELLLFMCVYAGFNKAAGCFGTLNKIFDQSGVVQMKSAIRQADYSLRDQNGKVVFYVLLWKRKGITLELFDNYWRNVDGPVCARLPSQHQYWQFHLAHNEGGLWPTIDGIEYNTPPEEQFDGIAELTFETEQDRQTWFKAAAILMDDEHNLFSKAIGYNTSPGNSKTYVDGIPTGDPNGALGILKFHVMVKKSDAVSVDEFRKYMTDSFAAAVVQSDWVLKFRLHLFEEVDNSRPDAAGVSHYEPQELQCQAAFEIAFSNPLEMEKFFASKEYALAVKEQAKYVKQLYPFPERSVYTFVYDSHMTLAGQRSSKVAELIAKIGATNQLKSDIVSLMSGTFFPISDAKVPSSTPKKEGAMSEKVHATTVVEHQDAQKESPFTVSDAKVEATTTNRSKPMSERFPGTTSDMVKRLFSRGEAFDSDGFITFFTDTPVYQFGNLEVCLDKAAIKKSVDAFFSQISAVYHDIKMMWELGDLVFVEMDAIYWRKDGSVVSLPCFDIFRLEGDKFSELRIFMDANPLFGPKSSIDKEGVNLSEQLQAVVQLSEAVIDENWEQVKTFLTEDIFYKVGSAEPVYGKQAVVDFLSSLFQNTAKFTGHEVRKIWNEPGIIAVEMDALYTTVKEKRHLTIACCDIYRMRGNQVSEWRVYVDILPFYQTEPEEQQPQENADGNKQLSGVRLRM